MDAGQRSSASAYAEPQTGQSRTGAPVDRTAGVRARRRALRRRHAGGIDLRARSGRGGEAARRARRASRPSIRRSRLCSAPCPRNPITDLAVHPTSRNSFISVMRGQGAAAQPALLRVDGAGKIDLVSLQGSSSRRCATCRIRRRLKSTGRSAIRARSRSPTWRSSTASCSSPACRTRSSRRSCGRFRIRSPTADSGTSVEIFHGNHGAFETRSPVSAFVPYTIDNAAAPDRRLPLHAAREDSRSRPEAGRQGDGHDDRRARQSAIGRST